MFRKKVFQFAMMALVLSFICVGTLHVSSTYAQTTKEKLAEDLLKASLGKAQLGGGGTAEVGLQAARLINLALEIVGVVVLLIMIYAGILWMNAQGNEDQVKKAQRMFGEAVMGVLIIFVSILIVNIPIQGLISNTLTVQTSLGIIRASKGLKETGLPMGGLIDIASSAGKIINFALGVFGLAILLMFMWAGYLWMTAQGNEDQVKKSLQIFSQAIIGTAIALISGTIANIALNMNLITDDRALFNEAIAKADIQAGDVIGLAAQLAKGFEIILGILGVVVLGYVIYAGYLWMNARGNEDQVEKSKKIFAESISGLFVIFMVGYIVTISMQMAPLIKADSNIVLQTALADNIETGNVVGFAARVGSLLNIFISLMGVIALVLFIYAGYLWGNARGNEDQVSQAKRIFVETAIALVVVFTAGYIVNIALKI